MSDSTSAMLVLGAAHLDHRAAARAPFRLGASNPGQRRESVGGAAFNAVTALRALERPIAFFAPRGGDASAVKVANELEALGIEDLAVTWLDRASPTYTALLDDKGELVAGIADMELYALVSPRLLMRRRLRDALASASSLLLDANFPAPTLERAATLADPACRIGAIAVSPAKVRALRPILPRLDALFLSGAEAASLLEAAPDTAALDLAQELSSLGVRRAVVTDGPRDATILDDKSILRQRPPAVQARDVTGAGDTLAGTAFHFFCAGRDWVESARLGIAGASIRVSSKVFPPSDFAGEVERIAPEMAPPETAGG